MFMATPASADEPVGDQRQSGFMTCAPGEQVGITSYSIGTVTRAWTTGGGPDPVYEHSTSASTEYSFVTSYTHEQAVTWYIEANPPGGFGGYYGLGGESDDRAFCA